ncbi:hypothetical protein B4U79_14524 [Dinothrombium tinctorium]|uniref:Myb-like domain-containing protein n=1 Tax=Dinothrombium tinctorium TaxID=1965070 RepID=A0A3S3NZB1_9ACAR|nr:hypothetical protein B4U79_14524 [Dinothrombium tinctorium]
MNESADSQQLPAIDSRDDKEKEKSAKKDGKRQQRRNAFKGVVDRSKLTMFDLISYNPPLSEEQMAKEAEKKRESSESETVLAIEYNEENDEQNGEHEENDESADVTGPRVKVGPNGEIVLDEESCVIKRKKSKEKRPIYENSQHSSHHSTTYASFRNRFLSKSRWTEKETVRFYTALASVGTDFSLMADTFFKGKRSRLDLRNKFKKEERLHKQLIDYALKSSDLNNIPNIERLDELSSSTDEEGEKEKD